jgi:hypothetical protein
MDAFFPSELWTASLVLEPWFRAIGSFLVKLDFLATTFADDMVPLHLSNVPITHQHLFSDILRLLGASRMGGT